MISGAHVIIYSTDAEADRRFFRDVLKLSSVDVGGGWLIFALPPAEVAVHPSDRNDVHEFYLISDDIKATVEQLTAAKIACTPLHEEPWGTLTMATLPGGGKLGLYQAKHARP
jgi:hypothetical protein